MNPHSGRISIGNKITIGYLPQEIRVNYDKSVYEEAATAFEAIKALEDELAGYQKQLEEATEYESPAYQKLLVDFSEAQERFQNLGGLGQREEVEKVLKGLGFVNGDFDRPVAEFSGGWQMRIELAKILLKKPNYVLLDEPTNHLDIESIIWLESFLKPYDGGIVLVSHDRQFLDNVTNRTVEILNGKVFDYKANYTKFVALREERMTLQAAEAKNQEKDIKHTEQLINKFRAKKNKAKFAQSLIKKLDRMEIVEVDETDTKKISFRFPPAPRSGQIVVDAKGVSKSYDELLVLDKVSLELERGEKIAFVGKNGEGKSTLSRLIAQIDKDFNGDLQLGYNVDFAYFDQNQSETLDGNITVLETIDNVATGEMRAKVRGLLGAFLFSGEDQEKKVKVLSGGEKSRLAFAKLLLRPVNLLILDEPTNHLDMRSKDILKQALIQYNGSFIVVSHDREFLQGLTDKVYEFRDKKLHSYIGDVFSFLDERNLKSFKALEMQAMNANSNPVPQKEKDQSSKLTNQQKRRHSKELSKINNKISKLENGIESLEKEIASAEDKIADASFFEQESAQEFLAEYAKTKEKLEATMKDWEAANEQLDKLNKQG